jgi:hypothetical protein
MATEIKLIEELIATRVPPGDRWSLVGSDEVHGSLTDTLEAYFQEVQQPCDFKLSPMKGELYSLTSKAVEKAPPPPPKKFNMYGDY